jgi:hypothetical protein
MYIYICLYTYVFKYTYLLESKYAKEKLGYFMKDVPFTVSHDFPNYALAGSPGIRKIMIGS